MNKPLGFVASAAILVTLLVIFFYQDVTQAPMVHGLSRDLRDMLWTDRGIDLVGQMLIILAGTFGVLVLTKERVER